MSVIRSTLIDWDQGKQYVLWTKDCQNTEVKLKGNIGHRVHKTYYFPKYVIAFTVAISAKKERNGKVPFASSSITFMY